MTHLREITIADGVNLDAFSRLRVSTPITLFESTFRYDLAPLQYEQITSSGSITHDATDSNALLSISAATGLAALQSYRFVRYQPGKSLLALITMSGMDNAANVTKRVGIFNATNSGATVTVENGVFIETTGASTINIRIVNAGTQTDQTVAQSGWNIDKLDGTGISGKTLNLANANILFIQLQWLGVGRVIVGFDIDGVLCPAHAFNNQTTGITDVYMQTAALPVRWELTTSASATAEFKPICASVISEGGEDDALGYVFSHEFTATAGNNARVHMGSIRPFLTFNSLATRYRIIPVSVETIVTGNNSVLFEAVYGSTFSAGPTWAGAAYSTYSGAEVTTAAGTIATSPIVSSAWYTAAAANAKTNVGRELQSLYPLTLDANGANRAMGTLSFYATGLGGTSACRLIVTWKEVR